MFETKNIEAILNLFNQIKKREAEKYCKELTINIIDLVSLILAVQDGTLTPLKYANHFKDKIPEHLHPTNEEIYAISKNGIGPLKDKAKKAITKMFQMPKDSRHLSAHLFYTDDYNYWHMFYFDQRDIQSLNNHWKEGPHTHYLSDLWSQYKMPDVWNKVLRGETNFPSKTHIRYQLE